MATSGFFAFKKFPTNKTILSFLLHFTILFTSIGPSYMTLSHGRRLKCSNTPLVIAILKIAFCVKSLYKMPFTIKHGAIKILVLILTQMPNMRDRKL